MLEFWWSNWMEGPCVHGSTLVCEEKPASKDISHSTRSSVFWKGCMRTAYLSLLLATFAYHPESRAWKELTKCLQKNHQKGFSTTFLNANFSQTTCNSLSDTWISFIISFAWKSPQFCCYSFKNICFKISPVEYSGENPPAPLLCCLIPPNKGLQVSPKLPLFEV